MSTIITILVALVIFGVLIISHEFGHFIVAKKSGVDVLEFSAGMGPLLAKKEKNGTQYSLRALPIGGFCRMKSYEDCEEEDKDLDFYHEKGAFEAASAGKRILILLAGAMMNFLVAILIFFAVLCVNGTDATTTIASVSENSPAYKAGIAAGDTVVQIDGNEIKEWDDLTSFIRGGSGSAISVNVKKADGSEKTYEITPEYNEEEQAYLIGITPKAKTNVIKALGRSVYLVGYYIVLIAQVFIGLFRGEVGMDAFSGPIGATVVIGQYIPMGLIYLLNIAASISISLGFFNLLPIPGLDGSRILFVIIEKIKGSPVNRDAEGTIHTIGMICLMLFAVFVAYKDIVRFF